MVNKPQRPFTVDGSTHASNPGNLSVDYFYWIRSFPSKPIQLILPLIILIVLDCLINWIFGFAFFGVLREGKSLHLLPSALFGIAIFNILFGIGIFWLIKKLIFLTIRIREHFLYGCVNPGVVVASKPPLIAVFTDLTTGKVPQAHFPAALSHAQRTAHKTSSRWSNDRSYYYPSRTPLSGSA